MLTLMVTACNSLFGLDDASISESDNTSQGTSSSTNSSESETSTSTTYTDSSSSTVSTNTSTETCDTLDYDSGVLADGSFENGVSAWNGSPEIITTNVCHGEKAVRFEPTAADMYVEQGLGEAVAGTCFRMQFFSRSSNETEQSVEGIFFVDVTEGVTDTYQIAEASALGSSWTLVEGACLLDLESDFDQMSFAVRVANNSHVDVDAVSLWKVDCSGDDPSCIPL